MCVRVCVFSSLYVCMFQLPSLLESIKKLRNKNEMPCFDPEDVIFITNKWDCIRSQLDVEKEKEKVWEKTKRDIKRKWEFVKEEHIFKMNCLDVSIETKTAFQIKNNLFDFRHTNYFYNGCSLILYISY